MQSSTPSRSKILFLPGKYPFCYYYRGYLPGVYSNSMVVSDFIRSATDIPHTKIVEKAKSADIIVLQRPNSKETLELVKILKSMGKKVVFENDDTYLVGKGILLERLENDRQRKLAVEMSKLTNEILALCDGAIASTEILADEYRAINPNVIVLKNCIDPLDKFPSKPNTTGKFRVGFIGSVTTNDDYVHIKNQIKQLDKRDDITLVVMGVKYKDGTHLSFMEEDFQFWNSIKNIEWHPYVNVTEYMQTVAKLALDVAIIPRNDSYFNRCKSNLKFLEMSLLKIPVIAQGFKDGTSPYQGPDSSYMTIITHNAKWYDTIIDVKERYSFYKELACKAHDYVLENYNIKTYAGVWVESIYKLVGIK